MTELKVPFGCDKESNIVGPEAAEKDKSYFCPSCGDVIILKRGEIKVPHFAHKSNGVCNQETITHKTAKLLVIKAIKDWQAGKNAAPMLVRRCKTCHSLVDQQLPPQVNMAIEEYRLPNGLVLDVALMIGDRPAAGIKILVTHSVDECKSKQLDIPFIEVNGYDILDDPLFWKPTIDKFRSFSCEKCRKELNYFRDKVNRVSAVTGVSLPTSNYYRYAPYTCWQCQKEILVFAWPNSNNTLSNSPSNQPVPKTIQYRYSRTAGIKYWANTCPSCNAIQGDFFLYYEPDSPLSRLNIKHMEQTSQSLQKDLMIIAHALYNNYDFGI